MRRLRAWLRQAAPALVAFSVCFVIGCATGYYTPVRQPSVEVLSGYLQSVALARIDGECRVVLSLADASVVRLPLAEQVCRDAALGLTVLRNQPAPSPPPRPTAPPSGGDQ